MPTLPPMFLINPKKPAPFPISMTAKVPNAVVDNGTKTIVAPKPKTKNGIIIEFIETCKLIPPRDNPETLSKIKPNAIKILLSKNLSIGLIIMKI